MSASTILKDFQKAGNITTVVHGGPALAQESTTKTNDESGVAWIKSKLSTALRYAAGGAGVVACYTGLAAVGVTAAVGIIPILGPLTLAGAALGVVATTAGVGLEALKPVADALAVTPYSLADAALTSLGGAIGLTAGVGALGIPLGLVVGGDKLAQKMIGKDHVLEEGDGYRIVERTAPTHSTMTYKVSLDAQGNETGRKLHCADGWAVDAPMGKKAMLDGVKAAVVQVPGENGAVYVSRLMKAEDADALVASGKHPGAQVVDPTDAIFRTIQNAKVADELLTLVAPSEPNQRYQA